MLAITQDRAVEKEFVAGLGIPVTPFARVDSSDGIAAALERIGRPAVLKTRRFGYDGKGQTTIRAGSDLDAAWREIGGQPAILEAFIPFEREVSIVAARSRAGAGRAVSTSPRTSTVTTSSRSQGCRRMSPKTWPPRPAGSAASSRTRFNMSACSRWKCSSSGTIEARSSWSTRLRPGSTIPGIGRMDGASVSQFEQHIRAVAGWPLGRPMRRGRGEMTNLIGAEVDD